MIKTLQKIATLDNFIIIRIRFFSINNYYFRSRVNQFAKMLRKMCILYVIQSYIIYIENLSECYLQNINYHGKLIYGDSPNCI